MKLEPVLFVVGLVVVHWAHVAWLPRRKAPPPLPW
jgi:hypothetical protein